jgi:transposase
MSYPSNLTDNQWSKISHFFPRGNQAIHDKRILVDAVRYLTKTGCQWRQLPTNFPPWPTVHSFFRRAKQRGIWEKILKLLVSQARDNAGRNTEPTYAIVDSQSVKTTGASEQRGIDGGKKNKRAKAPYRN